MSEQRVPKGLWQIEASYKKIKSGVADDTIFSAYALMFIASEISSLNKTMTALAKKLKVVEQKKWYEFWK